MRGRVCTHMSSSDNLGLAVPDQAVEWQKRGGDVQHRSRGLFRGAGVDHGDAAIMPREGKRISTWREPDALNPACRVIQELSTDCVERKALAPATWLWALVNALDITRENTRVRIRRASSQQHRVRMPGKRSNGASDWLLQVLRDPPIVLLLKVANGDHASPRSNRKLLLRRRPSHKGSSPVDPQEHQGRLPASGSSLPDVCVAI